MDGQMGWESSLWSNQQNGVEESFVLVNTGLNLIQEPEEMNWGDEFFDPLNCFSNVDIASKNEFGVQSSNISTIFSSDNNDDDDNNINTKSDYIVTNKEPHYHPDDHVNSNQESQQKREFDEISSEYDDDNNNNNNKNSNQNHHRKLGFSLISPKNPNKRARTISSSSSSNISFKNPLSSLSSQSSYTDQEPDPEAVAQMKEMIYRAAALRPVSMAAEAAERPRRRNVKISRDPQTVAARQRRERISERIRVLQKLVPGGSKMDTASMLDEAASYLKFLRSQVKALENLGRTIDHHHHHHRHHLDPSFIFMQDQGFFSKPINNC